MDCDALFEHREALCEEYGNDGLVVWGQPLVQRGTVPGGLPPGPIVVPAGVTVQIEADTARTVTGREFSYSERFPPPFLVTGPATALDVMDRLARHCHYEAARNYLLRALSEHAMHTGGFGSNWEEQYTGGYSGIGFTKSTRAWVAAHAMPLEQQERYRNKAGGPAWPGYGGGGGAKKERPPEMLPDPDPTAGMSLGEMLEAIGGQQVLRDDDPGSTYLTHFTPKSPPSDRGHQRYSAEWYSCG